MQHAATCQDSKLCMVYTLSPLAFRQASDKSSSFSSRNLSPMVWPSLLICPGHPNKNEATLCLSHMRLFWERNFKVATGHTQLENSHLFRRAFCLIIRAIKFTVFFACLVILARLRSFWVWGLAMEVSLRSDLTPWHPMYSARLQGLNLLDEEGTERAGSKVPTALHRTLWAATGRFGCG